MLHEKLDRDDVIAALDTRAERRHRAIAGRSWNARVYGCASARCPHRREHDSPTSLGFSFLDPLSAR
ncbi:hypothetical protein [Sandaracinus amylolyticus]|uniref:hypothetical protein n=1 Tax=Sandaracinus amylolyticus TaxID=927083 RepID=UPI001F1F0D58|nr:hypothetical protein [Sandaracinus amylolyticus]